MSSKDPCNESIVQSFHMEDTIEKDKNRDKMGILINSYKKEGKKVAFDQSTKFNNNESSGQDENESG